MSFIERRGIFGSAIDGDTLRYSCKDTIRYTTAFGLIYFGSHLLNIVAFRNAAFVAIPNFTNLIAMVQSHIN